MQAFMNVYLSQDVFFMQLESMLAFMLAIGLLVWVEWPLRPHQKALLVPMIGILMFMVWVQGQV